MMRNGNDSSYDHMEFVALDLLDHAKEPVGAARLVEEWRHEDIHKAEATAGRFLRQLDQRGYTELLGRTKGRVLSSSGRERLRELHRVVRHTRAGEDLQKAIDVSSLPELLELLHVRRLIEGETARLAALHATEDDINTLVALARCPHEGGETATVSMDFHRQVAVISGNDILIAVTNLLLAPENDPLEKMLSRISHQSGVTASHMTDHLQLAQAIRDRDAERANLLMTRHLDSLISAVEKHNQSRDGG